MYYHSFVNKFAISTKIFRTLLIFSLIVLTFRSYAFADLKKDLAEEYRLKGYEAQQDGKLDEALSFYTKAVSITSNPAAIYNDIGVVYEKLGLLDKAEASYLQAIDKDSGYLPAYTNLAYFYERRGDIRKAAEYLKKRIAWGDPKDPWTINAKAKLKSLSKQVPEVKRWLQEQEIVAFDKQITKAAQKKFYNDILQAKSYYEQGQRLAKDKKYEQAIQQFNRALSFTPKNATFIKARNQALLKLTQKKAEEYTQNALEMLKLGDTVSAKIEFRKILAIIPNEPIPISE